MIKLLICVFSTFALAVLMLQLREQRRELAYQANDLHNQIEQLQGELWNQQLQIAIYTAPNAIAQTVDAHKINMTWATPYQAAPTGWIDAGRERIEDIGE
jgi:cell division protein FtsL